MTISLINPDSLATPSGFTDADSDSLTYHYVWKNGTTTVGTDSATLDLSQSGYGNKGDTIHVSVTASDGTASSAAAVDQVTVANSAPVVSLSPCSIGARQYPTSASTTGRVRAAFPPVRK